LLWLPKLGQNGLTLPYKRTSGANSLTEFRAEI